MIPWTYSAESLAGLRPVSPNLLADSEALMPCGMRERYPECIGLFTGTAPPMSC